MSPLCLKLCVALCKYLLCDVLYCSNAIAGESALDRLACALGGKTMLPEILKKLPELMQHSKFIMLLKPQW